VGRLGKGELDGDNRELGREDYEGKFRNRRLRNEY